MANLAVETKALGFKLEQVQDFTPTPMTVATEIYATGVHPYDQKPVCVARTPEEKQEQRSFFFWHKAEMRGALRSTLRRLGLDDAAEKLLGGGSAKERMLGEQDMNCGGLPPMPRPKARKPWFRGQRKP